MDGRFNHIEVFVNAFFNACIKLSHLIVFSWMEYNVSDGFFLDDVISLLETPGCSAFQKLQTVDQLICYLHLPQLRQ